MQCAVCGAETELRPTVLAQRVLFHVVPIKDIRVCKCCSELTLEQASRRMWERHPPRIGMTGSRQWQDFELVEEAIVTLKRVYGRYVLVYGAHWEGADALMKKYAERHAVPLEPHRARWKDFEGRPGKNPAGQIRNREMAASELMLCVAFRARGKSSGTDGMRDYCLDNGIPTIILPERCSRSFLNRMLLAVAPT